MMFFGQKSIHSDDKYGECSRCWRELYRYDEAYNIDGEYVCIDCATEEEAEFFYAETMGERRENAYDIYMEGLYESILQGD